MEEIWKDIEEFKEYYEISNLGNVRRKKGTSHLKIKNRKYTYDKDGYYKVNLKIKQKGYNRFIHRLLAKAFIDNPENKPQVNHINGIKNDNRLENLEWCTLSENRQHAYDTGLQNSYTRRGSLNNLSKLTKEQVLEIRSLYSNDLRGVKKENYNGRMTMKMIGEKYNVTFAAIRLIVKNVNWKHI